jgi:hypothetical protein
MKKTVELDASHRIVLSREPQRAAWILPEANVSGRIIKRGKLKVWTGAVPAMPIEEAVEQSRHGAGY